MGSMSRTNAAFADVRPLPMRGAVPNPLARFALKGLRNCWQPEFGRWSHIYHLDGRDQPNQSIPESNVFYSLNVLLGMTRLPEGTDHGYDMDAIFDACSQALLALPVKKYAYGMALWTSAAMRRELPSEVSGTIYPFLRDQANWTGFRAQDIGMILTGLSALSAAGDDRGRDLLEPLFAHLRDRHACRSGLFYEGGGRLRRNFATFATQTYLTLACYNYHDLTGDERALELAIACTRRLIDLQGPQGEWPWFYFVPRGQVADAYEVYSVHQDGMAPAFLEHAEQHGVPGATDALGRGFRWILGENQLGVSMLRPDTGMIVRSHVRRGELDGKLPRMLRGGLTALTGAGGDFTDPGRLVLRLECRSYHLGWVLWSFAGRHDLPDLTHAAAFEAADRP